MEEIKVCEICRSVYCGEKCTDPNCEIIALREQIEKAEKEIKRLRSVIRSVNIDIIHYAKPLFEVVTYAERALEWKGKQDE